MEQYNTGCYDEGIGVENDEHKAEIGHASGTYSI